MPYKKELIQFNYLFNLIFATIAVFVLRYLLILSRYKKDYYNYFYCFLTYLVMLIL